MSENLIPIRQRDKLNPTFTAALETSDQTQTPTDQGDILRIYCQGVIRALIEERKEQNHGKSLGLLQTFNR